MKIIFKETMFTNLNKFQTYLLYFFLFSILGWILESIYSFIVLGYFTKRGFLYGPLCPIYGNGALILIIVLSKYSNNPLKLFTYSAIIFSVFEYIVSYFLEVLFNSNWWNYSNEFLNLNGRISIFYTIAWGTIAIIFIKYLYPFFKKKLIFISSKISYLFKYYVLYTFLIIFIFDTILSSIKYINLI